MSQTLAEIARESDAQMKRARETLTRAIRAAAAEGMTQAQIAKEVGRSQPEVSRLLHFHGTTPHARRLRATARDVRRLIAERGGRDVRVFGSVAVGSDTEASDIDLLFSAGRPLSLMQLASLEQELSELIGVNVDIVPDSALRPIARARILAEAVPL